jgi:hypothetical protein
MPNEKGNRYAIAALKDRRATMAGEIVQMKEGIAYREVQLTHLDAVLRELDPSYRGDTIPPKKLRRVKLFGNGELNRLIADALRRAEKPLASSDVADAIVEAKGYGRDTIHALTRRVRANLSYLLRHKRVVKTGDRLTACWSLPDETKEAAN